MDQEVWPKEDFLFSVEYFINQLFNCLFIFVCFFFRDKTGKFPDYPDDDEGGSAAIFKEKDPLEVILSICNTVIPVFIELTRILIKTSWTTSHALLII